MTTLFDKCKLNNSIKNEINIKEADKIHFTILGNDNIYPVFIYLLTIAPNVKIAGHQGNNSVLLRLANTYLLQE